MREPAWAKIWNANDGIKAIHQIVLWSKIDFLILGDLKWIIPMLCLWSIILPRKVHIELIYEKSYRFYW